MKYLLVFLCLFGGNAYAQNMDRVIFQGAYEIDCIHFLLENLVRRDTGMGSLPAAVLKKNVKTLYIQKTEYFKTHADTVMHGYALKFVDLDKDAKTIYKELKDSTASLFYMSSPMNKNAYQDILAMPLYLVKKGGKVKTEYAGMGCRYTFFFSYGNSRYGWDKTTCF